MNVLIKGMKMPEIKNNHAIKAEIRNLDGRLEIGIMIGGYSCCEQWCYYPIQILTDHGDLIDRDVVENAALMIWLRNSNGHDAMEQTIEHIRHNIKAVIPAERSGE